MKSKSKTFIASLGCVLGFFILPCAALAASDDAPITREQFLLLQRQNQQMQQQLQNQQQLIDSLSRKVADIQDSTHNPASPASTPNLPPAAQESAPDLSAASVPSFRLGNVAITGEGGLAFFSSQNQGPFPHPTFRIDEARLFLDAPVWDDVYFYSEVDFASRETSSLALNVSELYLDFEDISKLWNRDGMLNLRVGQFYVPFGEEYLNRFAINNPLISHSVSDIWGSDAGVELYGKAGRFHYVLAVQDGGGETSQSLQGDKSVTARLSYDPSKWLHLSASAMRTGNLADNNFISTLWFGNGWFIPLSTTKGDTFHANLVEGDVQLHLSQAEIKAAGGYIDYGDNDHTADNHKDVYYYYAEGVHSFTRQFYAAARFSQAFAPKGFPIVGGGTMEDYLFSGALTSEYWRLSAGLGWRFSPNLLLKAEYSFNQGRELNGTFRPDENAFALEAAFKF